MEKQITLETVFMRNYKQIKKEERARKRYHHTATVKKEVNAVPKGKIGSQLVSQVDPGQNISKMVKKKVQNSPEYINAKNKRDKDGKLEKDKIMARALDTTMTFTTNRL